MDDQTFAAVAVVGAGALGALAGVAGAGIYWQGKLNTVLGRLEDFRGHYRAVEASLHHARAQLAEALAKLPVDTAATAAALSEALEKYPAQTLNSDGQSSMGAEAMAFLQGERTTEDLAEAVTRAYPHTMMAFDPDAAEEASREPQFFGDQSRADEDARDYERREFMSNPRVSPLAMGLAILSDDELIRAYAFDWLKNHGTEMNDLSAEFTRRGFKVPTLEEAEAALETQKPARGSKTPLKSRAKKSRKPVDHTGKIG